MFNIDFNLCITFYTKKTKNKNELFLIKQINTFPADFPSER